MKIVTWNVNGIIPCLNNGSQKPLCALSPDLICFQETRTGERPEAVPGYHHHFWYPRGTCNTIAEAWNTESYKMVKLDLKKKQVRFQRHLEGLVHVLLPRWLTERKVPDDARHKIETFLNYIARKYNL